MQISYQIREVLVDLTVQPPADAGTNSSSMEVVDRRKRDFHRPRHWHLPCALSFRPTYVTLLSLCANVLAMELCHFQPANEAGEAQKWPLSTNFLFESRHGTPQSYTTTPPLPTKAILSFGVKKKKLNCSCKCSSMLLGR